MTTTPSMRELYLASLGGDGQTMTPAWAMALDANFGSLQRWRDEFTAMGRAIGNGSGWVLLAFNPREGTLVNRSAADATQALAGAVPLLALELDAPVGIGADAAVRVEGFMTHIDWAGVYARYQHAVHEASEGLGTDEIGAATLFDVRRAGVYASAERVIEGASWRDPAQVAQWGTTLKDTQPTVVYCVYGHEVCRATALRLRAAGIDARFLRGGIDEWQKAGKPTTPKAG